MKFLRQWLLAAAALALAPAALAQVTVSGVKYDETADVRGSQAAAQWRGRALQGGVQGRTRPGSTSPGRPAPPRRCWPRPAPSACPSPCCATSIRPSSGKLFSRGMEDNMDKAAFSKLIPGVMRMSQIFSDHKKLMRRRDLPHRLDSRHRHASITVKGVPQGEPFKEPEFFNALLRIWLGPNPGRLETQGRAAGQAGLIQRRQLGQRVEETVRIHGADRLAVVVAVGHQHHRAARGTRGRARRCSSRRSSACAPATMPSASQVLSRGSGSGFLRSNASPPNTASKNPASPLAWSRGMRERGGLVGEARQPQPGAPAMPPAPRPHPG